MNAACTAVAARAHPRACGENSIHPDRIGDTMGSSPRVRGKPIHVTELTLCRGLIPARAGKTASTPIPSSPPTAHPRACGENIEPKTMPNHTLGSSPRVRGKRVDLLPPLAGVRLIPARAGKTAAARCTRACARAHPRACGENLAGQIFYHVDKGSSPRVRGKRFLTWAFTAQAGQILETLEPSAFSGSYSFPGARANGGQCRARRRGLCTGPALGRLLGAS